MLFYSGNDSAAKTEMAALIDRIGFVGIDLGSLAVGGKLAQFPGGPLPNQNLVKVACHDAGVDSQPFLTNTFLYGELS